MPEDIDLATARRRERTIALAVGRRDGPELIGWGRLAAALAGGPVDEILVACPLFGASTRRLAGSGTGPRMRLVSLPALADSPEALYDEDASTGWAPSSGALLDRVLRVLDGVAIGCDAGAVRLAGPGGVLYLRGVRVLEIAPEGDGVGVECFEPERRHVHVSESNLSRWGRELSELVVQLAQDPRLLEREEARRDAASEGVAAAVGVRITSRWLPWTADGRDPVDWVGIDGSGRAVVGLQRASLGTSSVPAIVTACHRVAAEREQWAPGSAGAVRVVVASDDLDANVLELLESLGVDLEARPLGASGDDASERRGRRRSRRRRRPRSDEPRSDELRADEPRSDEVRTDEPLAEEAESRDGDEARADDANEADAPRGRSRRGRRRRPAAREEGGNTAGEEPEIEDAEVTLVEPESGAPEEAALVAAGEAQPDLEPALEGGEATVAPTEEPTEEPGEEDVDPVELEIEATLAEEPASEDGGEEPEAIEREVPRRRRQRAAIAVHNDADSILAALVLARERRHIVFFWVCSQDELMDFFRGKATDVDDNSDLLLVGFSAQPLPRETISTAELYRGRLQWFDHHDWAIEDLEALRDAIGSDSICMAEGAASPLVAVNEIAERRSRFTDKIVDLAARRLSEGDMEKWGYRLVALIDRMRSHSADYRNEISPVLSGKPAELAEGEGAYRAEAAWLEENDPRLIHFGEYQMAVLQVPGDLDAGEVARRARLMTGARISLSSRSGETTLLLGCNDEKRHINVMGLVDALASRHAWTRATPGGDRVGRLTVDGLADHPERMEALIGDIVRHKSILYG